jgi:molybdate transport system permease protein
MQRCYTGKPGAIPVSFDAVLSAPEIEALRLSLVIALAAVACNLPLALAVAWLLTRPRLPARWLFDALVHLPLVLPPVMTGYLLLLALGIHGPIGHWLYQQFGLRLPFTITGAVIATAVMTLPLMVRSIRIALERVDTGLEQAARSLGAGPADAFVSVTLPLMAPGVLAGAVTAFVAGLGEFGAVITFAGNIPGATRTLPMALYAALQAPDGDAQALRIAGLSLALGVAGLAASELLARRLRARQAA